MLARLHSWLLERRWFWAASLEELAARILAFQVRYEGLAQPFEWRFTRADLSKLLDRLAVRGCGPLQEAA